MFSYVNPFMTNYHFASPYMGCSFGCLTMGTPFVGMSVFSFNSPMNYYHAFNTPVYPPIYNPVGFGFGFYGRYNTCCYQPIYYQNIVLRCQEEYYRSLMPDLSSSSGTNRAEENAKKLGPNFMAKVKDISARLNCNYQDLIAVMISESGLNPAEQNKKSKATGLIQFLPSTAESMGTSVKEIKKMSAEEQLVLVERYLTDRKREAGFPSDHKLTAGELYALVFLPAYAIAFAKKTSKRIIEFKKRK